MVELEPINLGMPVLEIGAKWLVEMADYISDNPQFIINDFIRSGIARAADGRQDETGDRLAGTDNTSSSDFSDQSDEETTEF